MEHHATVRRNATGLPPCSKAVEHRHVRTSLQDVDLSFAGRGRVDHPIDGDIAALSIGDPLNLRVEENGRRALLNPAGRSVGRLAESFKPRPGVRCRGTKVFAVVGRRREGSETQAFDAIRCDSWEVVVPELVFEPER